ncbi:MAG: CAAD domain-containing protein [Potamolinea sp.]
MESNLQQSEKEVEKLKPDVNIEQPGKIIVTSSPDSSPDTDWQEWVQPVTEFLAKLPDYVGNFFSSYQQPIITLGLILSGIITVKVTLALLDAINDVPLLSPFFEVVGIGYTGWFIYRYLLKVETRQELSQELEALKGQVVGKK